MAYDMKLVISGIAIAGIHAYIAFDHWKEAAKHSRLITRSRRKEAQSIQSLDEMGDGALVKLIALLIDAEGFVSPIQLVPCAWWKCEVHVTYVKSSGRSITGGERQIAEMSSGNAWIYAQQDGHVLPIRLASAQVFPSCSFSGSVNALTSETTNVQHFVEKVLKPHLSESSETYGEVHRYLASGMESNLNLRICEYVLPLEEPHYIVGNVRSFQPGTDSTVAVENLSRFGEVLPKCISSNKTLIGSSGEEKVMEALEKQRFFQSGMAAFAGVIALAALIGCVAILV